MLQCCGQREQCKTGTACSTQSMHSTVLFSCNGDSAHVLRLLLYVIAQRCLCWPWDRNSTVQCKCCTFHPTTHLCMGVWCHNALVIIPFHMIRLQQDHNTTCVDHPHVAIKYQYPSRSLSLVLPSPF